MEHDNTITIITGLLNEICVDHLINSYADVKHKLVSTWNNQENSLLNLLSENGFIIVLNEYPEHKNTGNYQIICIQSALLKAYELNFKYVIRSRVDIFPNNQLKFINITRHLYIEKITVLSAVIGSNPNDYVFLDFIVMGDINELLIFYSKLQEPYDTCNIERFLLKTYFNQLNITIDLFNLKLNSCLKICEKNKIEFRWYRSTQYNTSISHPFMATGISFPFIKLIGEYCKASFIYKF